MLGTASLFNHSGVNWGEEKGPGFPLNFWSGCCQAGTLLNYPLKHLEEESHWLSLRLTRHQTQLEVEITKTIYNNSFRAVLPVLNCKNYYPELQSPSTCWKHGCRAHDIECNFTASREVWWNELCILFLIQAFLHCSSANYKQAFPDWRNHDCLSSEWATNIMQTWDLTEAGGFTFFVCISILKEEVWHGRWFAVLVSPTTIQLQVEPEDSPKGVPDTGICKGTIANTDELALVLEVSIFQINHPLPR